MSSRICALIFLFVSFQNTLGQEFLNCDYELKSGIYSCNLKINNPNGFDNFTEIGGQHLTSYRNRDVNEVIATNGSNSTNIPSIICEKFENVKTIALVNVGLEQIGETSFKYCKNIEKISINENKIADVSEVAFIDNFELNSLILEANQLTALPEGLFKNQTKLKFLNIAKNNITDLPDKVFQSCQNLEYLDMSNNGISILKKNWFADLQSLERLLLNDNKIVELPDDAFESLLGLVYLTLANNNISAINSSSFGPLQKLYSVNFKGNRINAIDEQFINKTGIAILVADRNICVNKTIEDETLEREVVKNELKDCFKNFENIKSMQNN